MTELFDISVHGFTWVDFIQHLFFDTIVGLGGYYARGFCQHTWHRVAVTAAFTLLGTFALVSLIG